MNIYTFDWRQWEPFTKNFLLRTVEHRRSINWNKKIADEVRKKSQGMAYAKALVSATLGDTSCEKLNETETLEYFIEFFWIMYLAEDGGFHDGVKLASSYCKKLETDYCPLPPVKRLWGLDRDFPNVTNLVFPVRQRARKGSRSSTSRKRTQSRGNQRPRARSVSQQHSLDDVHVECEVELPEPSCSDKLIQQSSTKRTDRNTKRKDENVVERPSPSLSSLSPLSSLTPSPEPEPEPASSSVNRKRKAEQELDIPDSSFSTSVRQDVNRAKCGKCAAVTKAKSRPGNQRRNFSCPSHSGAHSLLADKSTRHHGGTRASFPNTHGVDIPRRKIRKTLANAPDAPAVNIGCDLASHSSNRTFFYDRRQELTGVDPKSERHSRPDADNKTMIPAMKSSLLASGSRSAGREVMTTYKTVKRKENPGFPIIDTNNLASKRVKKPTFHRVKKPTLYRENRDRKLLTPSLKRTGRSYSDDSNVTILSQEISRTSQIHTTVTAPMVSDTYILTQDPNEGLSSTSAKDYGLTHQASSYKTPEMPELVRSNRQRPPLTVRPPIWAQSRQELCESCDFFKSYQGGVYFTKGFAKGYLLGGFPARGDIFHENGKLIISHGGGKAASKGVDAGDQSIMDYSVKALLNTRRTNQPIVLIADDQYAEFPFDLNRSGEKGYAYVVLGHYLIRDFWAEKHPENNADGFVVRFKFAFQWCGETEPWWTGDKSSTSTADRTPISLYQNVECRTCCKESPHVFGQGWMCLNPSCAFFFRLPADAMTNTPLEYGKPFLQLQQLPEIHLPDLCPVPPVVNPENGVNTTPYFYRGWHCQCGRLSSRAKWEYWQCAACERILKSVGKIRSHKDFWGVSTIADYENYSISSKSRIETEGSKIVDGLSCFTFTLPSDRGKIHIIIGSMFHNAEVNEIFKEFQEQANTGELPFRRYPLKSHQCRGTLLTNYFSQNCGVPYQYVGGADRTIPFDKCPPCITRSLGLIKDRAFLVLGKRPEFNELLNAAYMEKQSMGFHTDDEKGLGPIVSSLSMGSAAIMRFRAADDKKVVLNLILRHGDVVVMEGSGVQKYYEHTVIPQGFRIASTARLIGKENMQANAWR